ncbi:hypothetical protein FRC06_010095 [Ceratobasidium sp. 370]|nr:hypothetical protein FRC06_010095 [Ceratobasidium sp. 370]
MAQPEMSQKGVQNYGAIESNTPLPAYYVTPVPPLRTSFTSSRFFKAAIVALALLEVSWLGHYFLVDRHQHHPPRHEHAYPPWDTSMTGLNHDTDDCSVWDHYDPDRPHRHDIDLTSLPRNTTATTEDAGDKYTFTIPTSSARYHFASWGPIDKSRFEVVPVESDRKQLVVEVEVTKDPRGVARVCALPSTGDAEPYGVGFYAPRLPGPDRQDYFPAFKVLVYIPTSSSQQNLNAFETRLGQFEHIFPDLSQSINFSRLQTSAANVPMTFKSVVATSVHVTNANGPITGKLTSATDLIVSNANDKISGEYTLTQAGNIKLDNANAQVHPTDVQIRLKSGDFHPRPDYHITTSNANSPIDLTILEQPVGSGFFLKASNAVAAVRVHLHAAFEGTFKLSTVLNRPSVEVTNKEDPAGRGRERFVQFNQRGSTTSGRAGWGSPNDAKEHAPGNVDASTVMGPIELFFD